MVLSVSSAAVAQTSDENMALAMSLNSEIEAISTTHAEAVERLDDAKAVAEGLERTLKRVRESLDKLTADAKEIQDKIKKIMDTPNKRVRVLEERIDLLERGILARQPLVDLIREKGEPVGERENELERFKTWLTDAQAELDVLGGGNDEEIEQLNAELDEVDEKLTTKGREAVELVAELNDAKIAQRLAEGALDLSMLDVNFLEKKACSLPLTAGTERLIRAMLSSLEDMLNREPCPQ